MTANGIVNLVGAFTATGVSETKPIKGGFTFSIWDTFVGTVQLQRSYDGGTTWIPIALPGVATAANFSAPVSINFETPAEDVQHRVECTAFTSGTIRYRIDK